MNDFDYDLPPANKHEVLKCDKRNDLQGYLELEVSLINFITSTNTDIKLKLNSGKLPENERSENRIIGKESKSYDTPVQNVKTNNNKNSKSIVNVNEIFKALKCNTQGNGVLGAKENCNRYNLLDSIQVKIVWRGERAEEAANISISCKTQQTKQQHTEKFKLKAKRKYNQHQKYKQQAKRQYFLLSANNKLRYRICTNAALFLEYLRSCKPIKIIATGGSCSIRKKPLGQAKFSLPLVLFKKFNHNIIKGHNFNYKTKVYTLYIQHQESEDKSLVKSGEIQLRFNMLFAPTAAASASAVNQHANVVAIHDKRHPLHKGHHYNHHNHHHCLADKSSRMPKGAQGNIPKRLTSQYKTEEIVEAMMKLDAKLVAYLAGETEISSKFSNCEKEYEVNLNLENNNNSNISKNLEDLLPATKFNIFKNITGIKLEMEALTLQAEGTKCMKLMQNEIEPIFTVECQLSNELIKLVPRYDMFHIMQFESEKFQSLTQCTRFAQKAERAVKLSLEEDWSDENANETVHDFGRIHFTVWWREPGTCLNEMLGMGTLELNDLYDASLLEQCKRIKIQRRGKHLACVYFKVTLQRDTLITTSCQQMKRELFLPKQISTDSDSEKSSTTDKNESKTLDQQQTAAAQCAIQSNTAASSNNSGISGSDQGEYAENFLFLKHNKIQ